MRLLGKGVIFGGLAAATVAGFLVLQGLVLQGSSLPWLPDRPSQSFVSVPHDRLPTQPTAWIRSVRELDEARDWPALAPLVAEALGITPEDGANFPVLVPAGFADSPQAVAATHFRIETLEHGYYAIFQSAGMEIMVLGTAIVHHPKDVILDDIQSDYVNPFEDPGARPAGGRITFGHFGADYSVTFDCKVTSPGLGRNCINAAGAARFVAALVAGQPTRLALPDFEGS